MLSLNYRLLYYDRIGFKKKKEKKERKKRGKEKKEEEALGKQEGSEPKTDGFSNALS